MCGSDVIYGFDDFLGGILIWNVFVIINLDLFLSIRGSYTQITFILRIHKGARAELTYIPDMRLLYGNKIISIKIDEYLK